MLPRVPRGGPKKNGKAKERAKRQAGKLAIHAARVAAEAMARVNGEPTDDPETDPEIPGDDDLPAVPAREITPPKVEPPSERVREIVGNISNDPLAAIASLFDLMVDQAKEAALDPDIPAAQRRKETRTIALVCERLLPRSRLFRAEQTVLDAEKRLREKQAARTGAKATPRLKSIPSETNPINPIDGVSVSVKDETPPLPVDETDFG